MMPVKGFRFSGVSCGIKKNGKKDLGLVAFDKPCVSCGVFTKNRVHAPSVNITRERIGKGALSALVVVSGNASVCVKGAEEDGLIVTASAAERLGIATEQVAHATTGVIGVRLPVEKVIEGLPLAVKSLKEKYGDFSEAITTTDAFQKVVEKTVRIGGKNVNILGIGKGAGMIAPDMATMLMFIFTDVAIAKPALKKAFVTAVEKSFNSISVDGDTSTNDMVLAFASGMAANKQVVLGSKEWGIFSAALSEVCLGLAKLVVRDGEGATKLVEIQVSGAKNAGDARQIAKTVANSPLVKTAFFGEDPNWGRLMAAIGRSGVAVEHQRIDIDVQKLAVVRKGFESKGFSEEKLQERLKSKEINVAINLNQGKASTTFYTSDLTLEYVKINSAYRT